MNQKGQAERTGLAYEDGYNYWYNVEVKGKQQNWFIQRGKDFKNSFSFKLAFFKLKLIKRLQFTLKILS